MKSVLPDWECFLSLSRKLALTGHAAAFSRRGSDRETFDRLGSASMQL